MHICVPVALSLLVVVLFHLLIMDRSMAQKLNQSLQDEINVLKEITTKIQALVPNRAKLLSQYNENEMVKKVGQRSRTRP